MSDGKVEPTFPDIALGEGRLPGFKGFGPKALPFLKALKFHQSKAWFDENKALYENDLLAPMVALLDDLGAQTFMSGTDAAAFAPLRDRATMLEVSDGRVRAAS